MILKFKVSSKLALITLSILLLSSCSKVLRKNQIKPIIWGCNRIKAEQKLQDFSTGKVEPHPLDLGRYLFYSTHMFAKTKNPFFSNLSNEYLCLINKLYNNPEYFNNGSFKYNFPHGSIKPGWWSGMANSALVAGLTYADHVLETDNRQIINELIKNLSTSYELGGSLRDEDGESWILEYAWNGMEEESIKSVFNGFAFSLVCLETANQISNKRILHSLVKNGAKTLKGKTSEFYYENIKWTKYDLEPTIEPPHYAIFDIMLLESLGELLSSEDEWLAKDIAKRRGILKNGYKLELCSEDKAGYSILFSLIGPPHPYWIDIYPIELELLFSNGERRIVKSPSLQEDLKIHIADRGFVKINLTKEDYKTLKSVKINAVYSGEEQEIATYKKSELTLIKKSELLPLTIETKSLIVCFDGTQKEENIQIEPDKRFDLEKENYRNNIAQIVFPFTESQNFKENENIVLKVENSMNISPHMFFLYTESGKVFQRYYLPIKKGKNLIVLNTTGFTGSNNAEKITKIIWRIYTSEMVGSGSLKFHNLLKTKNNYQLMEILKTDDFVFEEKKNKGNIY